MQLSQPCCAHCCPCNLNKEMYNMCNIFANRLARRIQYKKVNASKKRFKAKDNIENRTPFNGHITTHLPPHPFPDSQIDPTPASMRMPGSGSRVGTPKFSTPQKIEDQALGRTE